ncbi:hypothetical protein FGRMN_3335 [Fusarium graminum]|nr:hypothetical protein FGRMN_3335 [Fusarium graminum]
MAPEHKRQSLADAFDGLNTKPASDGPNFNLKSYFSQHLSSLHLDKGTIRATSLRDCKADFSLIQSDDYRDDDDDDDNVDSDELHAELLGFIQDISDDLKKHLSDKDHPSSKANKLNDLFVTKLSEVVYGSNQIESVGGDLDVTLKLCRDVFEGKFVDDAQLAARDAIYEALKMEFIEEKHPQVHDTVLRTRREIIQHAKAAHYMITQVAILGKDLSEDIILEAHRLLTHKVDAIVDNGEVTEWETYSGKYRQWSVRAGLNPFMHHIQVPNAMKNMIRELESDIQAAANNGEIDPVALATKYCNKFVTIHPFGDGNGRICRLILNAILFKYSGCLVALGMNAEDRSKYLSIAAQSSEAQLSQTDDMDDLPEEYKPKHHRKLASFTLKHTWGGMRKIRQLLHRDG